MTQMAVNYGGALYELCVEEDLSSRVFAQLQVLDRSFRETPDFLRILASPALSKEERCQILEDSFRDRVHQYVLNFLKLLTEKGHIRHFSDCCKVYEDRYNADNGILPVLAETAVPLAGEQTDRLQKKLEKLTGKQVRLTNRVDAHLLGGIRLHYAGTQVDGTVQGRLEAMEKLLHNTVL